MGFYSPGSQEMNSHPSACCTGIISSLFTAHIVVAVAIVILFMSPAATLPPCFICVWITLISSHWQIVPHISAIFQSKPPPMFCVGHGPIPQNFISIQVVHPRQLDSKDIRKMGR